MFGCGSAVPCGAGFSENERPGCVQRERKISSRNGAGYSRGRGWSRVWNARLRRLKRPHKESKKPRRKKNMVPYYLIRLNLINHILALPRVAVPIPPLSTTRLISAKSRVAGEEFKHADRDHSFGRKKSRTSQHYRQVEQSFELSKTPFKIMCTLAAILTAQGSGEFREAVNVTL